MIEKRKWRVKLTIETIVEASVRAEAKAMAFNLVVNNGIITFETVLKNKKNSPLLIDVSASTINRAPDEIGGN